MQPFQRLVPQAYLTNFHNRIRDEDEDIPLITVSQPTRGHKRAKVVNYAEFDNDNVFDFDLEGAVGFRNRDGHPSETARGGNIDAGTVSGSGVGSGSGTTSAVGAGAGSSMVDSFGTTSGLTAGGSHKGSSTNLESGMREVGGDANVGQLPMSNVILPDLIEQPDQLSVLKYPKIRKTFLQGKIATPYRLQPNNVTPTTPSQTKLEPIIIPIKLNIEYNGNTINDYFTWNVTDTSVTPEQFAAMYCNDLNFSTSEPIFQQIVSSIKTQISELTKIASIKLPDFHSVINLTCNINNQFYEDNFQWNLNDSSFTPEMFVESVVKDLGLTRDFMPILTYSLYDAIIKVKKNWAESGGATSTNLLNDAAFGYLSGIRMDIEEFGLNWCPKVELLTQEEIQKREIEKERNLRRLKRESDRLYRRGRRRLDELETTMRF